MILDCEDNTLAFEKNYEFLGNKWNQNVVYCCLVRHCHISMLYFTNGYIAHRDIICIIVFNTVLMVGAMAFI